jgi:hypothetical protein
LGRASRRKKTDRSVREADRRWRDGDRADVRGRAVPPTIEGYEAAAAAGPVAVREALLARHNARMVRFVDTDRADYTGIRSILAFAYHAAMALTRLGARPERAPNDPYGNWADHIGWGIDSIVATARLMFAGQIVGAAMLIRQQLERWTENLAYNARVYQKPGESRAEFLSRVWALEDSPTSATPRNGRGAQFAPPINRQQGKRAGDLFSRLSELTHGRGPQTGVAHWDAVHLLDTRANGVERGAVSSSHGLIVATAALVIRRLRVCVESLAAETGRGAEARLVRALPSGLLPGAYAPPSWSLWPLVPLTGLDESNRVRFVEVRRAYDAVLAGQRPAGRLFTDSEMVDLFFMATRARSVDAAMRALEEERLRLGGELDLGSINGREQLYVFASEIAGLLARWTDNHKVADAASVAASTLRSAYWLWLEDDDRAMAMLRVVLEQAARIRTWRLKPEKASLLEEGLDATPRDWLEESGLRRLSALNRALGEISHFRSTSDWVGARNLIIDLQPDETRGEWAQFTGRGAALDRVALLLFKESLEYVGLLSTTIRTTLIQMLDWFDAASPAAERRFDRYMQHAWSRRKVPIQGAPFDGPANDHLRLWRLFGKATDDRISPEASRMLPFVSDEDPLGRPRIPE